MFYKALGKGVTGASRNIHDTPGGYRMLQQAI
jgi:hypothetical protein